MNQEKEYQIIINHAANTGQSYLCFKAIDNYKEEATKVINEDLERCKQKDIMMDGVPFYNFYVAPKKILVVEYDSIKNCKKRGGEQFKLGLCTRTIKYKNGTKTISEWYEAEK